MIPMGFVTLAVRRPQRTFRFLDQTKRSAATAQKFIPEDHSSKVRPPSQIPGPRRWPIIGSYYGISKHKDFAPDKLHLVWEAFFKEYGPIFRLDVLGQRPTIYIYKPEHVEKMLKMAPGTEKAFFEVISRVRNADKTGTFVKGESGLLFEGGEEGMRVRRLTQPPTMKMKTVSHYLPKMDSIALEFLNKLSEVRDGNNELPEDTLEHLHHWAMESLCLVTFGKRIGCFQGTPESVEIIEDIHKYFGAIRRVTFEPGGLWRWFPTPAYKRFEIAHNKILAYVKDAVVNAAASLEVKKQTGEDLDLIEKLLVTPDLKISDTLGYMVDFLGAGVDNTSSTVAFTMLNLAKHPDKQAKVQEELDRVLGKDRGLDVLTPHQLAQLSYLKATVKETLRLNPVSLGVQRSMEQDLILDGYRIPKGFIVFTLTKCSGMMEESFPKAGEFLPERWLRDRPMGSIDAYASTPFGIGPRMCIGRRFAEQEMYTVLARLFHKYNLEWKHGEVGTRMNLLLLPDKPLKFTMLERL